jgi:CelD/BcsL family acetyltransferase involved in cellulose biosynthesis
VKIARGAGSPIGQYDEVLLDPEADPAQMLSTAINALVRATRPDVIFLEWARADGALREALSAAVPLASDEAPFADLSRGSAHHLASLKSRVARQQRKRVRQFEEHGRGGFEVASEPEVAERWMSEALALKKEWLRDSGRVSRAFARHETTDCLMELARTRARPECSPRVLVSRLTLDERTAALEMGLCHRGVYHFYLGAFAPEFAKLGPGNVLTEKLIGWCAANGIERYDMMAPTSRNKSEWQSGAVAVLDFAIPTSPFGIVYVELVLRRLLPALRNAFYALPDSFRSRLAGLLLRSQRKRQALPKTSP